jgi:hypothetical protein
MLLRVKPLYFSKLLQTALLLLFAMQSFAVQLLRFEGRALDPQTTSLLYIEQHQVVMDHEGRYISSFVEYIDPEGRVFAEKQLDFSKHLSAPDLMFYDKRHEERTTVTHKSREDGSNYVRILVEQNGKREQSEVELEKNLVVIDGGFDRFIATHWTELREDKRKDFSFLAVTRSQLINFKVIEKDLNNGRVYLELHPRNFFIDLLVKPIRLEYDQVTTNLLRFSGLTNIERYEEGSRSYTNHVADIYYQYQPVQAYTLSEYELMLSSE